MDEIQKIISSEEKRVNDQNSNQTTTLAEFYLDAIVDTNELIKKAQARTWSALQAKEFNLSPDDSRNILGKYLESKIKLVIIHVDLVGFTKLCMTLSANRLADIIRAFTQEMSILICSYGGYIIKFVGDAVLGFFMVKAGGVEEEKIPSINALNCAFAMAKVIKHGINPILSQYDYPEIHARISVDVGENVVVQYGWEKHKINLNNEIFEVRKPIIDILGYTISIAVKMTSLAKPDQIVMGQMVFDVVDENLQSKFNELPINSEVWNYISSTTGNIYRIYGSRMD
jgi:class 3 adenylate cyclase